ncbi:MAG: LytTR family DNA-binding domain-containing protein [Saprospiraceae bacterium]|nr:LytTR family DNA-binding domain-containing protein [Saprospiraceae bacterium]
MEKLTCVIVEDEAVSAEKLTAFIGRLTYLTLLETFANGRSAVAWLNNHTVDLLFLDLHLGDLHGYDVLHNLRSKPYVIVTTAFGEYAIEGYRHNIDGYLLKPYDFAEFLQCINHIQQTKQPAPVARDYIFVRTEYRLEKVMLADILYLEGMKDYIKIVTPGKQIMTLMRFSDMMDTLRSPNFFRVHHSFIVAVDRIDYIERNRIFMGKAVIPISESRRDSFLAFLKQR